jgi:hypothetical protein
VPSARRALASDHDAEQDKCPIAAYGSVIAGPSIHRSSVSDDSGWHGNHENGRLALSASALASRAAHSCVAAS